MSTDLRTRLQRLRLQKVKRKLPPSVPVDVVAERSQARARTPIRPYVQTLPGREILTPLGAYHLIETRYDLSFSHGPLRLLEAFERDPAIAALLARDEALAAADLRSLAFLDTETTGLVGGAGTFAFLVGVGSCEGEQFVLRQYFLRDPGEEEAMLTALVGDLASRAGWVTFNGRAFDLPLLETRLTLIRQRGALGARPHLDLLMPARRLYRGRLESCALGYLEQHVFNIIREQDDVPGYLIPQMYLDYLRSGDPSEMHRVIYHNATDVLSMVTLTAHVLNVFATPFQKSEVRSQKSPIGPLGGEVTHKPPSGGSQKPAISANQPAPQGRFAVTQSPNHPSPEDLLRLACWHDDNGRAAEAEAAYRLALEGQLELGARTLGLTRLAALLKRANRRAEAAPLWEQLASFTLDDPEPFVELAKFYEWHAPDFALAERWAERALAVVTAWPRGWRREAALAGLKHRGERLQAKLTRAVTE